MVDSAPAKFPPNAVLIALSKPVLLAKDNAAPASIAEILNVFFLFDRVLRLLTITTYF